MLQTPPDVSPFSPLTLSVPLIPQSSKKVAAYLLDKEGDREQGAQPGSTPFGPLVRWLKVNFSESFCAWVHVKALRVFVESVLRYGLPVNFQAMLLHPSKKNTKRLRDVLNQLYGHLDSSALQSSGAQHDSVDIPGLGFGQSEYYAYVYYKINIDMVDTKV
uniref:V-type proton ATPase subunit C n=1 Tax=Timema poppense TaxID=170557 RepID=A0A7R9CTM5_TIMPO|nr:unnamed protein product [Timema poppensis]